MSITQKNNLEQLLKKSKRKKYYKNIWKNPSVENFKNLKHTDHKIFYKENLNDVLCVTQSDISYLFFSGGTSGNPKMIPFTEKEWDLRSEYRKECYKAIGINKMDKVAVMLPFGPWVAGSSAQSALMMLGCKVFPIGLSDSYKELEAIESVLRKHKINVIVTAPSYIQFLQGYFKKLKIPLKIKTFITSGEYVTDTLRKDTLNIFGAKIFSSYASSEGFIGIECQNHDGFHFNPEEVIIETIDEKTLKPTTNKGLILITILNSIGIPVIKYYLGDLGKIDKSSCSCGLKWPKVIWSGRSQEIFEISGAINVYSYQIRNALAKSKLKVKSCMIKLSDLPHGKDKVIFDIVLNEDEKKADKQNKQKLYKLLSQMSIDFNDAVYHELIQLKIHLDYEKCTTNNIKIIIKVIDNRKNVK
jgi:phenylacetate-CoA ligase